MYGLPTSRDDKPDMAGWCNLFWMKTRKILSTVFFMSRLGLSDTLLVGKIENVFVSSVQI